MVGTDVAMRESFGSAAHGAGRRMSRGAARRALSGADVRAQLEARGIVVKSQLGRSARRRGTARLQERGRRGRRRRPRRPGAQGLPHEAARRAEGVERARATSRRDECRRSGDELPGDERPGGERSGSPCIGGDADGDVRRAGRAPRRSRRPAPQRAGRVAAPVGDRLARLARRRLLHLRRHGRRARLGDRELRLRLPGLEPDARLDPVVFAMLATVAATSRNRAASSRSSWPAPGVAAVLPQRSLHPHRLPAHRRDGHRRADLVRRHGRRLVRLDRPLPRCRLAVPDAAARRAC